MADVQQLRRNRERSCRSLTAHPLVTQTPGAKQPSPGGPGETAHTALVHCSTPQYGNTHSLLPESATGTPGDKGKTGFNTRNLVAGSILKVQLLIIQTFQLLSCFKNHCPNV